METTRTANGKGEDNCVFIMDQVDTSEHKMVNVPDSNVSPSKSVNVKGKYKRYAVLLVDRFNCFTCN